VLVKKRDSKVDLHASADQLAKLICCVRRSTMLFGELAAASIICGGLIGISPRMFRGCLHFRIGNFIPEGGFFVLLESDLLIIHEKSFLQSM